MTSQGENSGSFKQLRHGGEILGLVGTGTKYIHTKQHSRQVVSETKSVFGHVRFEKWNGLVAWAERAKDISRQKAGMKPDHGRRPKGHSRALNRLRS